MVTKKIREVHKINAQSHEIQKIILPKCEALGLASERKGLFLNYALRPDYYVQINGSGLILEVERGRICDPKFEPVWGLIYAKGQS